MLTTRMKKHHRWHVQNTKSTTAIRKKTRRDVSHVVEKVTKKKEIASIKTHQQSFSLQSCNKNFVENAIARFELPLTQLSIVNLTDKTWLKIC